MAQFVIAHMYPDLMNLYGDRGNLVCLQRRIEWYGHNCRLKNVYKGEQIDFDSIDMLFMGGGSDREQELVYQDLLDRAEILKAKINEGLPVLCICGAYQLLGTSYRANDGSTMAGLGLFDFHTISKKSRLIGNILIECQFNDQVIEVVGFENHAGRTFINDPDLKPLGTVIKGYGNNGTDSTEGIKYKNLIGTYLHGPLLPKNPAITDWYINQMAIRRKVELGLPPDRRLEDFAHAQVKDKILSGR